jgi:hypothetical protein
MTQNTELKSPSASLSIWFFVGVLTLAYGFVLTGIGIYEFWHPLGPAVVLSDLHATFWWGILMTLFGSFYSVRFRPGKE